MKKTYLNPVAHVVELEEADIVTDSTSIMMCSEVPDMDNSGKGRERNSIWDD